MIAKILGLLAAVLILGSASIASAPRNIKWFAVAAAGALIIAGIVVWTTSSTQALVAAPKLSQIDPVQIMTSAKDLPTQTFEDMTFVF
jgi:hypothetical protein